MKKAKAKAKAKAKKFLSCNNFVEGFEKLFFRP